MGGTMTLDMMKITGPEQLGQEQQNAQHIEESTSS